MLHAKKARIIFHFEPSLLFDGFAAAFRFPTAVESITRVRLVGVVHTAAGGS